MTLNDILVSALSQLDRGHDAQTIDAYRNRLTGFANDAQNDLAAACGLYRTDELSPEDGVADLTLLPRRCRRVLDVIQLNKSVPFRAGDSSGTLLLPYASTARITYQYYPKPLSSPTDVSELNEGLHGLIVSYVVGRERMAGDVSTQGGGNLYLAMYEAAKAKLRPHMGEADAYRFINRY